MVPQFKQPVMTFTQGLIVCNIYNPFYQFLYKIVKGLKMLTKNKLLYFCHCKVPQ